MNLAKEILSNSKVINRIGKSESVKSHTDLECIVS